MTTSDWAERLKRGRWLLRQAADLGQLDPRLAAEWARNMRHVYGAFGWEVTKRAGALVVELALNSPSMALDLVTLLPTQMAKVPSGRIGVFLEEVEAFGREEPSLALVSAQSLPEAMRRLQGEDLQRWCASVRSGAIHPAQVQADLSGESATGKQSLDEAEPGLALEAAVGPLLHYVQAHTGRYLPIDPLAPGSSPAVAFACDGHRIFLPERIADFGDDRDALSYRVRAALAAGFVEFGSFDLDLARLDGFEAAPQEDQSDLERLCAVHALPGAVRVLFEAFERIRIEAALGAAYPGLARDIALWKGGLLPSIEVRVRPENRVDEVLDAMERIWMGASSGNSLAEDWVNRGREGLGQGVPVEETARLVMETAPLLMALLEEEGSTDRAPRAEPTDLVLEFRREGEQAMDRRLREIREDLRQAKVDSRLEAIRASLEKRSPGESYGEMAAFLERNPPPDGGLVDDAEAKTEVGPARRSLTDALSAEGGVLYPEWDENIEDYRPDWVRVVEYPIEGGDAGFAERTRAEHGRHIDAMRRRFEAMRPESFRRIRGQVHGDALDLDRAVEAWVEGRSGRVPTDRIYSQTRRTERSVAVAFLVDLSSSTNEPARFGGKRIIDVEKEALMVTAEALEALGDPFAVYGFSGFSREEVAFYTAKDFQSPYDAQVRAKIGAFGFKMENRDGAAIRHAGAKLLAQEAKTRVLFLLSDGKPLDCGCPLYKDEYAQADTRMALQELRKQGIKAFCITVDPRGADYLAYVYGKGNYTVVDDVERLPLQLPGFYQRIAT
jgi:hypothetical protein